MSQEFDAARLEDLPEGWYVSNGKRLESLQRENEVELPAEHPLAGIPVRVIAHRNATDDVLLEHLNSDSVSVVHLTWRMARELPNHPTLEFTGSFAAFLAWEAAWPNG